MIMRQKFDGKHEQKPAGESGRENVRTGNLVLPWWLVLLAFSVLAPGILAGPASAYSTPDSIVAAGKLYVSNVTYDPEVFFSGDTGTITFEVTNGATDQGIVVNHATMSMDNNFRLTSPSYDYSTTIGPGKSKKFIFTLSAAGNDGKYFPSFSLSLRDADSLWQTVMMEVDNTPLELTLHSKPDTFTRGKKDIIDIQVANPRNNGVRNVILELSGDGTVITPSRIFIGTLGPGESKILSPEITPSRQTLVTMKLMYDNGDNPHETKKVFPVEFALNKKRADPVISNIMIENDNGLYRVTGDVTNAGLETANAVTITSLPPAQEEDPFKMYIVGALKADDFASFEVTFSSDSAPSIPLQVSYKDIDGNLFSNIEDVKLENTFSGTEISSSKQAGNDSTSFHTTVFHVFAGIVIIAVLGIVVTMAYKRMKKR